MGWGLKPSGPLVAGGPSLGRQQFLTHPLRPKVLTLYYSLSLSPSLLLFLKYAIFKNLIYLPACLFKYVIESITYVPFPPTDLSHPVPTPHHGLFSLNDSASVLFSSLFDKSLIQVFNPNP